MNTSMMKKLFFWGMLFLAMTACTVKPKYTPAPAPMMTPFAQTIDPEMPLPEYPRPQLEREEWMNLNGLWDYTIESIDFEPVQGLTEAESWTDRVVPEEWTGKILVPFAVDAPLSGVGHILRHNEVLWYQRFFNIPSSWDGKVVWLHFAASDWETSVYVNGERIGQHRGGYDPFSFDITPFLQKGKNKLHVCVWDATENQSQAIGKQIMPENRQGFRYQPTGGIWQTVWLEPVAEQSIESLKIIPEYDASSVRILPNVRGEGGTLVAQVYRDGGLLAETTGASGEDVVVDMAGFEAWSPGNPVLYDLKVLLKKDDEVLDEVKSYFGMRKVEVKQAADGFQRIHLNNEPLFQYGPLDQGYWPDGVLTPPGEEAIKFDLQYLKDIGCNMVRVHIKTHPARWYYHADKMGLLVWQDMICMPKYGQTVDDAAADQWHGEFKAMVDWLHNHPSIIMWVVFNEGWSQHNTEFYTNWIDQYDSTRIINCASGWDDYPVGDVVDVHDYTFYPRNNAADFKLDGQRALVIGEAAGINLAIPGHTWYSEENKPVQENHENYIPVDNYSFTEEAGRHTYGSPEVFQEAYEKFIETTRLLNAGSGCDALVYTQITDVEHELNGYLTYDRKVSKIDKEVMRKINEQLYSAPELTPVVEFSSDWKTPSGKTIQLPVGDKNEFIPVRTVMDTPVEMEKSFELAGEPSKMAVAVKGFNDGEIRINGKLFRKQRMGARWGEPGIQFFAFFGDEMDLLKSGENTISVKTTGKTEVDLLDVAVYQYQ